MAEVPRAPSLESLVAALPNVIHVVRGVYWTVPCPAESAGGRAAIQWTGPEHVALQVTCSCGTPPEILSEALGIPASATAPPPPAPTFIPIDEFMAQTGKEKRWLLEPYVPNSALVLLQGAPKSGKTFFAGWLACELARLGVKTLFVEEEGSVDVQGDRFRPFLPDGGSLGGNLMVAFRKRFRLDVPSRVDGLINWIKQTGAQCVVLDPFKLLHQADEQSASELTPVLDALQRVITETGATIILIHHTKKGSSWDKGDTADAQSQDARGSGAIIGHVDHVMAVKGVPPAQRVVGEVRFTLENSDSRVAQPFERRMGVVTLSGGFSFAAPQSAVDRCAELLERALAVVPQEPGAIGRQALRKVLGCSLARVTEACKLGIERGLLANAGAGIYRPQERNRV